MKPRLGLLLGLALARATPVSASEQAFEQIEHGRYLATAADCVACHTIPGGVPFAGGRAIQTPFGTLLSPNLTPDRETGIGAWTDAEFLRAMREGIGPNGEHFYPAFPYPYFSRMTPDDIVAIRRYLNTLDPVRNPVEANQLPFPFSIRGVMSVWNALFFTPASFTPHADKSPEWNRGAYLVEGPGHCGACHTAKNALGGDVTSRAFQGGSLGNWFAPNITGDARVGLGGWSVEETAEYLGTGHNRSAAATGPMAEVVSLSTSRMEPADLRAMALYLKDLPGLSASVTPAASDTPFMRQGKLIFEAQCAACHQSSGAGVPHLFPALAAAPGVQAGDANNLMRVVLEGGRSVATAARPTAGAMPAFGWKLSDEQVASVLTYVRNTWGNAAAPVGAGEVAGMRVKLKQTRFSAE